MTTTNTPQSSTDEGWSGPVAGLARLIDGLRRDVGPLTALPTRMDELAEVVARLAETVAAIGNRRAAAPAPTWLLAPTDSAEVGRLLEELAGWMQGIFLRYPDGAAALTDCWCRHPDVVEELLWLMHAWAAAYQGPAASVALAGDWHDRQRPGVVRRVRQSLGSCSRERHQTRAGRPPLASGAPSLPAVAELGVIAAWWSDRRDDTAPEPTDTPADPAPEGARP